MRGHHIFLQLITELAAVELQTTILNCYSYYSYNVVHRDDPRSVPCT